MRLKQGKKAINSFFSPSIFENGKADQETREIIEEEESKSNGKYYKVTVQLKNHIMSNIFVEEEDLESVWTEIAGKYADEFVCIGNQEESKVAFRKVAFRIDNLISLKSVEVDNKTFLAKRIKKYKVVLCSNSSRWEEIINKEDVTDLFDYLAYECRKEIVIKTLDGFLMIREKLDFVECEAIYDND